jgi:hypothetical protein
MNLGLRTVNPIQVAFDATQDYPSSAPSGAFQGGGRPSLFGVPPPRVDSAAHQAAAEIRSTHDDERSMDHPLRARKRDAILLGVLHHCGRCASRLFRERPAVANPCIRTFTRLCRLCLCQRRWHVRHRKATAGIVQDPRVVFVNRRERYLVIARSPSGKRQAAIREHASFSIRSCGISHRQRYHHSDRYLVVDIATSGV